MTTPGLTGIILLALFFIAAQTVLPGLLLNAYVIVRRILGKRSTSPAILGPIFWHELVTVTRRGVPFRLRLAYVSFLLLCLLIAYISAFSDVNPIRLLIGPGEEFPRERVTAFAERYFQIFLFCQLIALTVVTPILAGGAITEEHDRQTLVFLQSSLLSNREIVLGKLSARLIFLLGLAVAGLPVLALTLLFGGVDPDTLLLSYLAAAASTLSLASFSFWQATRNTTLRGVLLAAYPFVGALIVLNFCCFMLLTGGPSSFALSPFVLLLDTMQYQSGGYDPITATAIFIVIHGLLGLFFTVLSMGNVRAILIPRPMVNSRKPAPTQKPPPDIVQKPVETSPRRERPPVRLNRIPALSDEISPFLWKEIYFGGRLPTLESDLMRGCGMAFIVASLFPLAFGVLMAALTEDDPQSVLNPTIRISHIVLAVVLIPFAGIRVIGSVVLERQRQTLDSLFTLPVDRTELLTARFKAAAFWLKNWLIAFVILWAGLFILGFTSRVGLLATLIVIACSVPFFLTFAIWLSVRCGTVVRAATWFALGTFAIFLLPPMLAVLVRGTAQLLGETSELFDQTVAGLSVPTAIDHLLDWRNNTDDHDSGAFSGSLMGSLFMSSVFLVLSWCFWRSSVQQFESQGR